MSQSQPQPAPAPTRSRAALFIPWTRCVDEPIPAPESPQQRLVLLRLRLEPGSLVVESYFPRDGRWAPEWGGDDADEIELGFGRDPSATDWWIVVTPIWEPRE